MIDTPKPSATYWMALLHSRTSKTMLGTMLFRAYSCSIFERIFVLRSIMICGSLANSINEIDVRSAKRALPGPLDTAVGA